METERREMPASPEAEENVLGACLVDGNETIAACLIARVSAKSFYLPANQILFQTIADLFQRNPPVTLEMLAEELKTRRQLEAVGGFPHLMEVTGRIPTTAHAGYFIAKLREKQRLRDLIRVAQTTIERVHGFTDDIETLMSQVFADFSEAVSQTSKAEQTIQAVAADLETQTESFLETGLLAPVPCVPWGLVDLDRICRPMEAGELVVLGGRPSTGKSALADQVAWKTAEAGGATLLFTYEMTKREKAVRIAQQMTGLNYRDLPALHRSDQAAFSKAFLRIKNCRDLHVFERDTDVASLTSRVRTLATRQQIKLIVVDFLQYLARLEPIIGKERTDEKVGRITAAVKNLASECKCPVLMLASLNREGEREGRPPRMSDLRASGEIESDADVIALLHWPAQNAITHQPQDPHDNDQRHFYVEYNQEKGRNKGVHQVGLLFDRAATRFQGAR